MIVRPGENPIAGVPGELWDIVAEIDPETAQEVGFKLRGHTVAYIPRGSGRNHTLASGGKSAPLPPNGGRVKLRILLDRSSVEIFGNDGEVVMPFCFLPDDRSGLELFAVGGAARIASLSLYPLGSIWRG
jgi:sucrose-6-phosphate hydrolase SacC (GH32 family)